MSRALLSAESGPLARALLDGLEADSDAVRVLEWRARDDAEPGLRGATRADAASAADAYAEFGAGADLVLHCDAADSVDPDAADVRARVLAPLDALLGFVEAHACVRLGYVSTAHVSGLRRGLFTEVDCEPPARFRNALEAAKLEAERRLRASPARARIAIFRPALCLDPDQPAGFGAFLGDLAEGRIRRVCGDPAARVDLIPVAYARDAILAISRGAAAGGTYHLVAGWERSLRVDELIARLAPGVGVWPAVLEPLGPSTGRAWSRYLRQGCVFDDFFARAALSPSGVEPPGPDSWLPKLRARAGAAAA